MATPLFDRIALTDPGNPNVGRVRWAPLRSLWWSGHVLIWLILGTLYLSWSAVVIFVLTSGITLCFGHSIGMHRLLIHRSFSCGPQTEAVLVALGTLVGLGGPRTMTYMHDLRDWAQRSPRAHPYLRHGSSLFQDFFWQLHGRIELEAPPRFKFVVPCNEDLYRWMERLWPLTQVPLALALYAFGGWGWVAWGVSGRIATSIFFHWLVGYFAHNQGQRDWLVQGAAVQGYNLPGLGLLTFGECWHNNHHAFPESACLGLKADQLDPGWLVLRGMEKVGLVWDLQSPESLPPRCNVFPLTKE